MAYGTEIIVSSPPRGLFREGTIKTGETPKPGTVMQIDFSAGLTTGTNNWTYEVYNTSGDGKRTLGPMFILLPDPATNTWDPDTAPYYSAYAALAHCFVYTPAMGEEFNMILEDVGGTADDHPLGEILMVDDGTGKLLVQSSADSEPFALLEAITAPATDSLAHVIYQGY